MEDNNEKTIKERPTSTASSFMNLTTVHICTEIVVLIGIVVYFFRKNSALVKSLNELTALVHEQNDIIQRHEEILKKIVGNLNAGKKNKPTVHFQQAPPAKPAPAPTKQVPTQVPTQVILQTFEPSVLFDQPLSSITEVVEEEDLDNEIQQELAELA